MPRMPRLFIVLLLLLLGAAGIGLCLQVLAPAVPPVVARPPQLAAEPLAGLPQGHLYTGIAEQPTNLNPFTTDNAVVRSYVLGFTHDTLLDLDPVTGALRGALAEDWVVAADGASMTVTLRDGVHFSDGAPLTTEDVLFTNEVNGQPELRAGALGEGTGLVAGVEVLPGPRARLRIAFSRPYFAAAQLVGESWIVVQKHWFVTRVAELARDDGRPAPAIGTPAFGELLARITDAPGPGTGPYLFADDHSERPSWRRGRDLTLLRNERCWQRLARPGTWNLAGIRLLFLTDAAVRHATLLQRGIDWFAAPDLGQLLAADAGLAADYRREVYDKPTLGVIAVQWNTTRPQLQDPRVRRALGMLFDRQQIVDGVLGGVGRPASAFGKPDQPGYPRDLAPIACDPPAARRLLREAGFVPEDGKPLQIALMVPAEVPFYRQIGELAAANARLAGVELDLQVVLFKELLARREGGTWDGALVQVSMPTAGDPYEVFHSHGNRNAMHWRNAAADALLEQQRVEKDPARRAALLEQFHHIVDREQPVALLVHLLAELLINDHLQNAKPGPRGLWPERFWVPLEFQRSGP